MAVYVLQNPCRYTYNRDILKVREKVDVLKGNEIIGLS